MNIFSFFSYLLLLLFLPKCVLGDCDDISNCQVCEENQCIKCESHYTKLSGQRYCYPCDDSCKECDGEGADKCTECNNQFYLEYNFEGKGRCLPCKDDLCDICQEKYNGYSCTKCKSGYYLDDNNDCQKCYETCDTCTGTGESQCLTCKDGFYDPTNSEGEHECVGCANLCKKCHGPNIEDCEECNDGYYFSNNQCKLCDPECATCKESATYCTSCKDGLYLEGSNCFNCAKNCKKCKGPGEYECTECFEGSALEFTYCRPCVDLFCPKCISVNNYPHCIEGCLPGYRKTDTDGDLDERTINCEKCNDGGCQNCDDSQNSCNTCFPGYVLISGKCHPCEPPCKTCNTDQSTCESCTEGFYFDGQVCQNCPGNCLVCDEKTGKICSKCKETFYAVDGVCTPCHESCQVCHDDTNSCDICKKGYYFDENYHCQKCSQNCADCNSTFCFECELKFYPDGKECKSCDKMCEKCSGPSANDCISCSDGYFASGWQGNIGCVKCNAACTKCNSFDNCFDCSQGYFLENNKCTSCEFNCLECESLRECKKCKEGFRLYQREGETDHDCQPCKDRGCKTCDSSATECTQCIDGFYPTPIQGTNFVKCTKCPSGCKECSESGCTDCFDGFFNNGNGACVKCVAPCATCTSSNQCLSCVDGYLFDGKSSCNTLCSRNCLSCEGTPDTCTSCHNGYGLKGAKCESCVENCKVCDFEYRPDYCLSCNDGYYFEYEQCRECSPSCKTCTSYDTCSSCAEGYYFTNMNYNPGTYYTGQCDSCSGYGHEHCLLCIENCNDDDQFTCSEIPICTKCEDGFYIDEKDECQPCDPACIGCTGGTSSDCIACNEGYFQTENGCESCHEPCLTCGSSINICTSCNPGYFLDGTTCKPCDASKCNECKDKADYCTKCTNNKYSYKGGCYSSCDQAGEGLGIDVDKKECYECQPLDGCVEMNDGCQCKLCQDGYFLTRDEATRFDYCERCKLQNCKKCGSAGRYDCKECMRGYYVYQYPNSDAIECKKCESPCIVCSSSTQCTECIKGYYPNSNSNCVECPTGCADCSGEEGKTCTECKDGFYLKKDTNTCEVCNDICTTCHGASVDECDSCKSEYHLVGTTCTQCDYPCATCSQASGSECLSCSTGFYLSEKTCKNCTSPCLKCINSDTNCISCIPGFFLQSESNTCSKCAEGCESCQESSTNCQSCFDGYALIDSEKTCSKCEEGCATCSGTTTNCKSCIDGYYHNNVQNTCHLCESPCGSCSGAGNHSCTSCIKGYVLNGTVCDPTSSLCQDGYHCDLDNSEGTEYKNYTEQLPAEFTDISNKGNGGALSLTNFAFVGANSTFTKCTSLDGGGGAIFICNYLQPTETSTSDITLINLEFVECKAKFGAAVYIYSPSKEAPVRIFSCVFKSNELTSTTGVGGLKGGAALYLTAADGLVADCKFKNNKGIGGNVKISENFKVRPITLQAAQREANGTRGSVVISGCEFEIDESSDCSLFYANEKMATNVEVSDCSFAGVLAEGAHFIDGNTDGKETPSLSIKSCKFSADTDGALNSKFLSADLGNQVLAAKKEVKLSSTALLTLTTVASVATIIITMVIVKYNHRDEASVNKESVEA